MSDSRAFFIESGMRYHREGTYDSAVAAYRQALLVAPGDPQVQGLLGTALLQGGDAPAAIGHLESAVIKQRRNPGLLATLAQAHFACGNFAEALKLFRQANRLDPAEPQFILGLANSHAMQGQFSDARALLERLVKRHPDLSLAWFNLGNVLRDLHQSEASLEAYRRALTLDANLIDARNSLGSVLHSSGRLAEAEHEYRQCIALAPQFLVAHQNLASVLIDQGRNDDAEAVCKDIIQLDPTNAQAHGMLADTFNARGLLIEAQRHYEAAWRLDPGNPAYQRSYAAKLWDTGNIDDGLRIFKELLLRTPDVAELHQLLGMTFLMHGFLAEGWSEYRHRPAFKLFQESAHDVSLTQVLPEWLDGLHVCVQREQGLGDEIFFLRYARELVRRGARVTYRSSHKIASLVRRLPEISRVIDAEEALPNTDITIMVGDLPHALGNRPGERFGVEGGGVADGADAYWTYPWSAPRCSPLPQPSIRIAPLDDQLKRVQSMLTDFGPPPYIGITWRGGTPPREQGAGPWVLFKSLEIRPLGRALNAFSGTFIALQRNPEAGELAALESVLGRRVHDLTTLNEDLEAMLALLSLIDEYVGVSNTNMHLRACAGKTARVLVPAPAEWRWMASGEESPWFPGFAVYRQSVEGDWAAALDKLAQDLALRKS